MNLCAKDLNPFRSIVASSLFFYCKLEMIQFDKAGLHIHHVRFTCYRFFMCVFLQVHRRENTFEILRVHTDDIDITHLNCVSLSFGLLWKLKPYKNLQNLRTKCQNVSQIRRGKSYSKHQHRFACYYIYIFFFWRCTGSLFWRKTTSPLRKTKVQQKGMFSVNTQLPIHLPGTRRQCSTIWDRRESPMIWYSITFAVWFFSNNICWYKVFGEKQEKNGDSWWVRS